MFLIPWLKWFAIFYGCGGGVKRRRDASMWYCSPMRRAFLDLVLATALTMAAAAILAQTYPARPITIVTPATPFSLTDISARLVALKVTDTLGQPVGVQNRMEAGGTAGIDAVARAAPDGYTLLVIDEGHTIQPHLVKNLPYDALADFAPVSLFVRAPFVLVVNTHVPARTVAELAHLAKARPGLVTFATTGPGSPARLLAEMLKLDARVSVTGVPYPDLSQALAQVAGGGTDAIFTTVPAAVEHLKTGRVRALAVTTDAPSAALPDVPLMKSSYPEFVSYFWVGMLAPMKTPAAVLGRLNGDVVRVLRSEELKTRLGDLGLETVGSTPGEFEQLLRREFERWGRVVKDASLVTKQP